VRSQLDRLTQVVIRALGLPTAAARFLADSRGSTTIASLAVAQLLVLVALGPVLLVAGPFLSKQLGVTTELYMWGMAYTVLLAWQLTAEGVLGGIREFGRLARFNILSGFLFIVTTVTVLARGQQVDFRHYIALSLLRAAALVALCGWSVRSRLGEINWREIPSYFHFGMYQAASALTHFFVLGSIDSIMLNAYHGPAAVGLYGAYYASFNVVVSRFMRMFSTVFLPTATAHARRDRLLWQLAAGFARSAWVLVLIVTALSFFLFQFYGSAYSFSLALAALMGVCVTLHVGVAVLIDLTAAEGVRGVRRNLVAAVFTATLNVVFNLMLIPRWGVMGTMIATAIAFACGLAYRYTVLVKLHRQAASAA